FILVKIEKKGVDSGSLFEKFLQKGLMIRDCGNFRNLNKKFIRVAVRKRDENTRLVKSLREVFEK
ncbi:MAG: threonine-phosphate decarboxylase, partial [Candidatus Omnitrophota bacterium]|nr:threonine-phosphate decarboxylase [Candidatus Omnitrophota bacterium]